MTGVQTCALPICRAPTDIAAVTGAAGPAGAMEESLAAMVSEVDRSAPFWCVMSTPEEGSRLRRLKLVGSNAAGLLTIAGEIEFANASAATVAAGDFDNWRDERVRAPWNIPLPVILRHMSMSDIENVWITQEESAATLAISATLNEAPAAVALAAAALPFGAGAVMPRDLPWQYNGNLSTPFWVGQRQPIRSRYPYYVVHHWHWGPKCLLSEDCRPGAD